MKYRIADMTSPEVGRALEARPTVLIPVGSTEVLGNHGPTGADHFVASEIADRIGETLGVLVTPAIPFGDAQELASWPGTITIRHDVLKELYLDICTSLVRHGATRLIFLNTHMINLRAIDYCGRALRRQDIAVAQVDWWRAAFRASADLIEGEHYPYAHGGEVITSVVMAVRPDLVDLAKAVAEEPKSALAFHAQHLPTSGGPFYTYPDFRDYCESGAWGDPSHATAEKGIAIVGRAVSQISAFIASFEQQVLSK